MNIFKVNKIINRLNQMIDNAVQGRPIENGFDETKMSALETKLAHYLAMNSATKVQLAEEKERINQLISDISHQTKTPIANILLYAQLLEESNLDKQNKEYVSSLIEQAEKLNFLMASLIKTSRLEAGIISVVPTREKVQTILDHLYKQVSLNAIEKNIALNFENTEIRAMFDLKWTMEAIYNLVDNAIKYTPSHGSVSIKVAEYEMFIRIDISDTGIGIREEEAAKIFTRFYRSHSVSHMEGVGIGLYLAREIISSQGGYIKLSSTIGEGSTFSVFLSKE